MTAFTASDPSRSRNGAFSAERSGDAGNHFRFASGDAADGVDRSFPAVGERDRHDIRLRAGSQNPLPDAGAHLMSAHAVFERVERENELHHLTGTNASASRFADPWMTVTETSCVPAVSFTGAGNLTQRHSCGE